MSRQSKIESYGRAHAELVAALKDFPRAMWGYRPAPDAWTIHEIVVHIADSEANSYVRGRRFIAEPGSTVMGYNEMKWARDLRYSEQDTETALELFRWLRGNTHTLIRNLPEAVWANTVTHSDSGLMTMDDWLDTYERHIREHVAQMRAVYAEWLKR
ncbi:MAG: DinB family protein [Anaerolineales bacterium]